MHVCVCVWYELTVKGLVCVCRKWEAVTRTTKTGDGTDGRENSRLPRHILVFYHSAEHFDYKDFIEPALIQIQAQVPFKHKQVP